MIHAPLLRHALLLLLVPLASLCWGQEGGRVYGGAQNEQGYSLTVLADGNYAVVGRTRSEGAGANDMWVIKIDAVTGNLIWTRTFGTEVLEQGHWVEATPDGGMVVLGFSNGLPGRGGRHDYYLLKLDQFGQEEWSGLYGGINREIGFCVHPAYGSGYVLVGYSKTNNIRGDIWVVRVDAQGEEVWDHLYESPFVDYGHQITQTPDGGYLIVGSESGFYYPSSLDHAKDNADLFLIKTDSAGTELWRKVYGGKKHELGRSIHAAPGGGWYLFGSTQSEGAGSFDQFLVKVDENGDSLWRRTYGGAEWDYGNSIDLDSAGNLYLLGTTNSDGTDGSPDIWLQKTDESGNLIWALTMGGAESDYGYMVRALPGGGCLVVGATRSFGSGGQDVFLARVTSDGKIDLFAEPPVVEGAIVYPIPVSGESVVDPRFIIGQVAFEWRVYDAAGRLVVEEKVGEGQRTTISGGGLARGVYLYEIRVGQDKKLGGKLLVD